MNTFYLLAALVAGAATVLHVLAAGPAVTTLVLAARDLERSAKMVSFQCWHMVSIILATMCGCFLRAAHSPESADLALLATGLAGAFAFWSIALAIGARHSLMKLPLWMFFVAIAVFGALGGVL